MSFFDTLPNISRKSALLRMLPVTPDTGWKPPAYFPRLNEAKAIGFDCETREMDFDNGPGWGRGQSYIAGFSISAYFSEREQPRWYFPVAHSVEPHLNLPKEHAFAWLKETLETPGIPKFGANLLYDYGNATDYGIWMQGELWDCQFGEALLDETEEVALDALGVKYLGQGKETNALYDWCARAYGGEPTSKQRANIHRTSPRLAGPYAEQDASMPREIMARMLPLLKQQGLLPLFRMECDLIPLLVAMRRTGVRIDMPYAEKMYDDLKPKVLAAYAAIKDLTGIEFVDSGKQIQRIFEALRLPFKVTAKGNASFTKDFLQTLDHPIGRMIMDVRQLEDLRETFVGKYLLAKNVKGRVHCQFNPLRSEGGGTRSGRFSCAAGWTPVLTSTGEKRLDAVRVGDKVWTHQHRWRSVTATWLKGTERMYDVRFSNGHILTCTGAHRLLVQQFGQLSFVYPRWAQKHSLPSAEGSELVTIEAINLSGSYKVYDITVDEDESYAACGVFSHNSSTPNLQNIPSRSEVGRLLRRAFIPDEGHMCFEKADYSQIEYRELVHFATGDGADALRQEYAEAPKTDYHKRTQRVVQQASGLYIPRKSEEAAAGNFRTGRLTIKEINFGLLYGMGKKKLARTAGLTEAQANDVFAAYHSGAPYVAATMQWAADQAQRLGYTQDIMGRRSRFDLWEPVAWSDSVEREIALSYSAALGKWGPNIKRAMTHKALNRILQGSAATQLKMAMWACMKQGVYDVIGVPRLTVHDENSHSVISDSPEQQQAYAHMHWLFENCLPQMRCPVVLERERGPNWGECEAI